MTLARKLWGLWASIQAEAGLRLPPIPRQQVVAKDVIVSLTSFPARIDAAWLSIESILRQDILPERIVLVLAEDEFSDVRVPESLNRDRLELLWVAKNTKSYKKLVPTRKKYPHAVIVTADDDVMYPRTWLSRLLAAHRETPNFIIGTRGAEMLVEENGQLAPYVTWPGASLKSPPDLVLLKGDGGILYPPKCLPAVAFDEDLALSLCPTTDDIWFRVMALLQGTKVRRSMEGPIDFPVVRRTQRTSLRTGNVSLGGNDSQLAVALARFGLRERLEQARS